MTAKHTKNLHTRTADQLMNKWWKLSQITAHLLLLFMLLTILGGAAKTRRTDWTESEAACVSACERGAMTPPPPAAVQRKYSPLHL